MQITRGKVPGAQKATIYGPEGIGKSTLAAKFPNPLFIDTEGSTKHMDVARTPNPSSWAMLLSHVAYVKANPTVCDTLIIDTADWAETLCIAHICAERQWKSIEDAGYGKGYTYLEETFGKLLNILNDVIECGIHVVFTAHAQMRKFEQPDEAGAYDRWEMKLEKKIAALIKEWADMVLFAGYQTYVVNVDGQGVEKGKNKARGGKRIVYTQHHPCWDAKNRHDLPAELDLDFAGIAHCFPLRSVPATKVPAVNVAADPSKPADPTPARIEEPTLPTAAPPATDGLEAQGVPRPLADLMLADGVSVAEIQEVVAEKGYFPADTPFANYPKDFVEGVLIAAWPQVSAAIKELVPF
ncbi:MAG: ATP-binding protein [Deltaproteobacteria bacterium]|nr:ATP-binding protein [Deltaproteobacteria bacterium]